MFSEDYDPIIKKSFLGKRNLYLASSMGLPDEGLELKVWNGLLNYDIFFLYKSNATYMWSALHGSTRLYKYFIYDLS